MVRVKHIAQTLIELSRRPSIQLFRGELVERLTSEGLQLAIDRRWLVPTDDVIGLMVTPQRSKIEEFTAAANSNDPDIGDPVVVGDGGVTYSGVVQQRLPDGSYTVSFEQGKGPKTTRPYKKEEVKVVAKADPKIPPGTVAIDKNRQYMQRPTAPAVGPRI